jgi:GNAT superfamily N-acetyltransferase
MLYIEKIDTNFKAQVRRFVRLPFQFYENTPQWVPPILIDIEAMLDRKKHPFYQHSEADFFIAVRDGKDVGRIGVFENKPYNKYRETQKMFFFLFECEDNLETAQTLFDKAYEWGGERGLDIIVGPKGIGPFDGYGILETGFEHRQMMTMMTYNHAYLPKMMDQMGFEKEVDFVSCYLDINSFNFPERIHRIAERVKKRGAFEVMEFNTKKEVLPWAPKVGEIYDKAFKDNWEYYPLSEEELNYHIDNVMSVVNPKLAKVIVHDGYPVGFLLAFPDVSAAIQRSKGMLFPFGIFDMLLEMKRTNWVAINGAGILPEFQGRGGNALLYSELEKTVRREGFKFEHADLTQVAETAVEMRQDLINLGGKPYKNHRVYRREI